MTNCKTAVPVLALIAALLFSAACGTPSTPASPMQAFYQSLAATQATLQQISLNSVEAAKYRGEINKVIASYNVAEASFQTAYASKASDTTQLANDTALLVDQVALLVSTFAPQAMQVRFSERAIANRSVNPRLSLTDILTILQIAATSAQAIPAASPYAGLAALILQATDAGVLAYRQSAGAIDPAKLAQLPLLSAAPMMMLARATY